MSALLQRLPPRAYVEGNSLSLATGQALDTGSLRDALSKSGYRSVPTVYEHGEFALRGSLMDIFPMGSKLPLRIDLLDDEIDTLRCFDPDTQRTVTQVEAIELLPAREFPLDQGAIRRFQQRWYERFDVDHDLCPCSRKSAAAAPPAARSTTCPCSSTTASCSSTTSRNARR
jgi:transcription-repair coupling factor (superfamily II helicase)